MDPVDIKDRRLKYLRFAVEKGLSHEDAEDFAQEALIRWLNAGAEIGPGFLFSELLSQCRGGGSRRKRKAFYVYLDRAMNDDTKMLNHEAVATGYGDPVLLLQFLNEEAARLKVPRRLWQERLLELMLKGEIIWMVRGGGL